MKQTEKDSERWREVDRLTWDFSLKSDIAVSSFSFLFALYIPDWMLGCTATQKLQWARTKQNASRKACSLEDKQRDSLARWKTLR